MNSLPEPLCTYVNRFNEQYENLNLDNMNIERLMNVMIEEKTSLNNLFMAGLGASTLILRLGAIIQLSKKLKEGTPKEDALLIKQIVENLSENLPSDTSWKIIWYITCADSSPWKSCVTSSKGHQSLIEKFITFRNKYVHGYISLREQDVEKIASGINTINKIVNETSQ